MAKKRANGDGNLRKRPNGLWELTTMIGYQPDGRRKTKSFYGKTQKEARDKAKAYMQALGVDLATIQSLVGHADIDMTEHCLHVQEPIRQDAIARFSRAFGTAHGDPEPPDEQRGKIIPFPLVG